MSQTRLIYTTWPDSVSAEAAAGEAVRTGLAACANILPGATSIFAWEGAVQRENETVMLLKTSAARAGELAAMLAGRHPYDTPAIVALTPDEAGSARPFLDWVVSVTGGGAVRGA